MTTREVFDLVAEGREHDFYCSATWHRKRAAILKRDRYECQLCKARGRYRKAELVHHVNHLKDRPDLALSVWDPDTGERQLVSLCKRCHEEQHPESQRQFARRRPPLTSERWD